MSEKLTKKDLNAVFWRLQLLQASWNYERMQSLGYFYSFLPALKKIYKDDPPEERTKAIQRHLEFFNTMPSFTAPILGINAALEEKQKNEVGPVVSAMKVGLMGPLAGLGDAIIWLTWRPICFSIGAAFLAEGNPIGLLIALVMFNAVNQGIRYYGIHMGYQQGVKFIENASDNRLVQRYTTMATILGLMIIGGLVPQMVRINIAYVLELGELRVVFQDLLDGIIPALLPLLTTFAVYKLIKRGIGTLKILFSIIGISIILVLLGIL